MPLPGASDAGKEQQFPRALAIPEQAMGLAGLGQGKGPVDPQVHLPGEQRGEQALQTGPRSGEILKPEA